MIINSRDIKPSSVVVAVPTALPLVNGDFETGDATGWTTDIGTFNRTEWAANADYSSISGLDAPNNGTYVYDGGNAGSGNLVSSLQQAEVSSYQDFDVSADGENSIYKAVAELIRTSSSVDYSYVRLELLDISNAVLSSAEVSNESDTTLDTLLTKEVLLSYTASQQTLRVRIGVIRSDTPYANGGIDNVSVELLTSSNGSGGGGSVSFTRFDSDATLTLDQSRVAADSSGGVLTLTLPSSPADVHYINVTDIGDSAGTNNVVLTSTGPEITDGALAGPSLTLQQSLGVIELMFDQGNNYWRVLDTDSTYDISFAVNHFGDTYSPTELSSNMSLGAGDTKVISSASPTFGRAAVTGVANAGSGLYYVEFEVIGYSGQAIMFGVANQNSNLTNAQFPGEDSDSSGLWRGGGGQMYQGGTISGNQLRVADGSNAILAASPFPYIHAIAINANNGNIWHGQVVGGVGGTLEWYRDQNNNPSNPGTDSFPHDTLAGTSYRALAGDGSSSGVVDINIVPTASRVL